MFARLFLLVAVLSVAFGLRTNVNMKFGQSFIYYIFTFSVGIGMKCSYSTLVYR